MACLSSIKVKEIFRMKVIEIGVIKQMRCFNRGLVFPGELLEF